MRPQIPGWTEQHRRVGGAVLLTSAASLTGLADSPGVAVWVAIAVGATAVVSLAAEPFAGFVVGLVAAAALIAGRRTIGPWGPDAFWLSLLQTLGLITSGVVWGRAGAALRPRPAGAELTALPRSAFGSLGLLEVDIAMERLEEEVDRAVDHRRPLVVVLLDTEVIDPSLDADARHSALRAVARIFEGRLREGDVPFALAVDRLGAILPETTSAAAWERIGRILDAVNGGSFTTRAGGGTGDLGSVVQVDVGMAQLDTRTRTASDLFDAATEALRREHASRAEETA